MALTIVPRGRGVFREQLEEVLTVLQAQLSAGKEPMQVTLQTIFLRDARDRPQCERKLRWFFGTHPPVFNFVLQAPCCGAGLAIESWAIGGESVKIERFGPNALAVTYDDTRWIYCGGIESVAADLYSQTLDGLAQMRFDLERAECGFDHVLRTWFYLGGITANEGGMLRYQKLNRSRADFYQQVRFPNYPASTGIGAAGKGLTMSCLAMQTGRKDTVVLPLENPNQTPAWSYEQKYSPQSPRFSRAMALALGSYTTTWISGTASIVGSDTCHRGNVAAQTEQTITNIERLISHQNFAASGMGGAGAGLKDLAKIRVYLKRSDDFPICREICERRFGSVPAIYVQADICRPELLVEIEGVAFSRNASSKSTSV